MYLTTLMQSLKILIDVKDFFFQLKFIASIKQMMIQH